MTRVEDIAPSGIHPASESDFLAIPRIRDLQLTRLRAAVRRACDSVELHARRLHELGIGPDDIRSLDDLPCLPFTVKSDLRDAYPFGLFAVPMSEVVRLHASSGTTGKPIVAAYTKQDLEVWTNVMVRVLVAGGAHRGDIVQNSYGYGLFTGGLGFHYGAEALGAAVIPISSGNTDRQIMVMKDFGATLIACTPSYFVHLIERAGELGVDVRELPLRAGLFGAEPWSESLRDHVETVGGIRAVDTYGLSEIIGPGVAVECPFRNGLHVFEDHFYPEIVDPDTGEPLPDGVEGELVLTTLTKQAMPLIRYRTRDITSLDSAPCPCGRTLRRIARVGRRCDDMLIIRGVNVYPSGIESVLLAAEGTLPHYQIILTRHKGLDQIEVQVEATPEVFAGTNGVRETLAARLTRDLDRTLGLRVDLRLVEPRTIERSQGKARRVIDRRNGPARQ